MSQELSNLESTIDKMRSAIERCDVEGVRAELRGGYKPGTQIRDRYTALHLAVISKAAMQLLPVLVEAGFDLNSYDIEGKTPLHWALERNVPIDVVKYLIDAGTNVAVRDNMEATLLMCPAQTGAIDVCNLLIDAGVDVALADKQFLTPLHMAAWNGHIDVCRLLVAAGASPTWMPEFPQDDYLTPFQIAVRYGQAASMRYFIMEHGEDISQKTLDGRTLSQVVGDNKRALSILTQFSVELGVDQGSSGTESDRDRSGRGPASAAP